MRYLTDPHPPLRGTLSRWERALAPAVWTLRKCFAWICVSEFRDPTLCGLVDRPRSRRPVRAALTVFAHYANIANMDTTAVIKKLKTLQGQRSLRAFAADVKCSPAYLSDIYNLNREPGPTILAALGLEKQRKVTVTYKPKRWR